MMKAVTTLKIFPAYLVTAQLPQVAGVGAAADDPHVHAQGEAVLARGGERHPVGAHPVFAVAVQHGVHGR